MSTPTPPPFHALLPYIVGMVFIVSIFTAVPLTFMLFADDIWLRLVCVGAAVATAYYTGRWSIRWLKEEYEDCLEDWRNDG